MQPQCLVHSEPSINRQVFCYYWASEVGTSAGDVRDTGSIPGSGRSPGRGHGNTLHYSCLETPMDRGAWRATAPGVTQSRTQTDVTGHRGTISLKLSSSAFISVKNTCSHPAFQARIQACLRDGAGSAPDHSKASITIKLISNFLFPRIYKSYVYTVECNSIMS